MDTSPEKFYDSLLSYEAPSDDFVSSLAEPHAMEEPEEVPPEDYKVGMLLRCKPCSTAPIHQVLKSMPGHKSRSSSSVAAASHDRRRAVVALVIHSMLTLLLAVCCYWAG